MKFLRFPEETGNESKKEEITSENPEKGKDTGKKAENLKAKVRELTKEKLPKGITEEMISAKMLELYTAAGYTAGIEAMEPEARLALRADAINQLSATLAPAKELKKPVLNENIFGIKTKGLEKAYAVPLEGGKSNKPDDSIKLIRIGNKLYYDKPELSKKEKTAEKLVECSHYETLSEQNIKDYRERGLIF